MGCSRTHQCTRPMEAITNTSQHNESYQYIYIYKGCVLRQQWDRAEESVKFRRVVGSGWLEYIYNV